MLQRNLSLVLALVVALASLARAEPIRDTTPFQRAGTGGCACDAGPSEACGEPTTVRRADKKIVVAVDWCHVYCEKKKAKEIARTEAVAVDIDHEASAEGTIIKGRVTEDDTVVIRVRNFNFLSYSLDYSFDVSVVDAYVTLDQLFRQVANIFPLAPETERAGDDPLVVWYQAIENRRAKLGGFLATYAERVALCPGETETIRGEAGNVAGYIETLEGARQDARESLTSPQIPMYETIKSSHDELVRLLVRFRTDAHRTADGDETEVGTANGGANARKAGSYVSVSLTPTDKEGNPHGDSYSITYFVHSKLPVVFHVGLAVTNVQDIEFETVRALASSDLFSEVRTQENIRDFSAFLSFEFLSWSEFLDGGGVSVTLGTSLNDIGSTIHAGASVRLLKRVLITVGGTSQQVQEGQNPIVEQLADRTGTRELFDGVVNRRDWGFFTAVSFSVF